MKKARSEDMSTVKFFTVTRDTVHNGVGVLVHVQNL